MILKLFNKLRLSENTMLITIAVILGMGTAALVLLFRRSIVWFDVLFNDVLRGALMGLGVPAPVALILLLAIAGFCVGLIMQFAVGEERYRGVAAIVESVAVADGRLKYRIAPFKALAAAMSLGAGASLGAQDPSVQIGANLGSFLGRGLHMTEERTKLMVAAGAASATAATFNAPIAGVFFAMEVILGQFSTSSISVIILSAVVASAITKSFTEATPMLADVSYVLGSPAQLPFYALLGVVLAALSVVVLRFLNWQADQWPLLRLWPPLRTALTGMLIGGVGVFLPELLGPGESFMQSALAEQMDMSVLLLLVLAIGKLLLTGASQGGGFMGGLFAPTLFIGIVSGSSYGTLIAGLTPLSVGNAQVFAIAGMSGLLAGVVRAPITAILLVFELTDDYLLILPIMLTAVTCSILVEWTGVPGIYMAALAKQGLNIHRGNDIDVMQSVRVDEAMQKPALCIWEEEAILTLRDTFHDQNSRALCVLDTDRELVGIVTLSDLQRTYDAVQRGELSPALTVREICTHDVVTIGPGETLWTAARNMGERELAQMPVVAADGTLVGMLRRQDLVKAYNIAISRKFHDQHYAEQIRLNTLTGAHIVEYEVHPRSQVAMRMVSDLEWPYESVIASISRQGKLIIPHGNTVMRPHDQVTVVTEPACEPMLEVIFGDVQK